VETNRGFSVVRGGILYESKLLKEEDEIYGTLGYMVDILQTRLDLFIELKEIAKTSRRCIDEIL
jgi:hypothetical protein